MPSPYQKEIAVLETEYSTNITSGLSNSEVAKRIKECGLNQLPEGKADTWISIFIRQFQSPLIYVLLIAAIIIFFIGEHTMDAFILSGILFFNAIIGTIQEGRTGNIIASLRRFMKTKSVVIREGSPQIIDDQELVIGDIIVLKEGERVPADARIFYTERLNVDESVLTGESTPVKKIIKSLQNEKVVADQANMVFKGTYVVSGYGKAIVIATGQETQIGQLHKTIQDIDTDIPLKRELDRLSYIILLFIFGMCASLLIIGLLTGRPFQELMVMLTALFICVVPEGLPVVLTLILVSGALRMAKKQVLIKNLQGVEALGRTDVIVIDKTGTLTRNEMIVTQVYADNSTYEISGEGYFVKGKIMPSSYNKAFKEIGVAATILNSTEISFSKELNLFEIKGDPTEAALYVLAQKMGYDHDLLVESYKELYEIPFNSDRKYHAGFFKHEGSCKVYVVGAPEAVFQMSRDGFQDTKKEAESMLKHGLRVVAVGVKSYAKDQVPNGLSDDKTLEAYIRLLDKDIEILGVCGIQDSIRPEVAGIIQQARDAGLRVIMATGDHKDTAEYVAKHVGIYKAGDVSIDGATLETLSDDQLDQALDGVTVFARVSPQDKVRIINALHKRNYIVAMTGDGVNDVPSLLAADLGIAMGRIGTELTKEASDLVLLDDSFASIMYAVEQGRHIFYTLRRVVLYFFATNMGEVLIVLFALLTNLPLPLTASQILWLNFVTDGFLDVSLSMEPEEPGLLKTTLATKKLRLVDKNLLLKMIYFAVPMGVVSLIIFTYCYNGSAESIPYARTMTLITMAMFQWFNAWNCRSETRSIFEIGLFSNKWLVIATVFVLSLQFALLYIPFMQYIFKTVPLSAQDWVLIVSCSAPIVVLEEVRKWIVRRSQ